MRSRLAAFVASLSVFGMSGVAVANPAEIPVRPSPLEAVLSVAPGGFLEAMPEVTDPHSIGSADFEAVLGVVLSKPFDPWSGDALPPTLADVIGVVDFADWNPYNPPSPGGGFGGQAALIAETSAAWKAQMDAYYAQTAQSNAQQMTSFSEAIQAKFDLALDPNGSPFDDLVANELLEDGGLLFSEFDWGRGDLRNVANIYAKFPRSQSGFFGE